MRRFLAWVGLLGGGVVLAYQQGVLPPTEWWMVEASGWAAALPVRPEPPRTAAAQPVLAAPAMASVAVAASTSAVAVAVAAGAPRLAGKPEREPGDEEEVDESFLLPPRPARERGVGGGEVSEPLPKRSPQLLATHKETWVYAAPSFKARKLGYLRAGARVARGEKAAGWGGCEGGWYRVEPKGFVCVGSAASLDLEHPVAAMAARRPDRSKGLPYLYGMSRFPTPPFYLKLPTAQEQQSVEGDVAGHLRRYAGSGAWLPDELDGVPPELHRGRVVPSLTPQQHGSSALYAGRAVPRSGFGLVSQFEWEGRRWGLTTDFQIVPVDRLRLLRPSDFHGVELGEGGLPAAFNQAKGARMYRRDGATGQIRDDGPMAHRQGLALTGKREVIGGAAFLELRDGRLVRDTALLRLDPPKEWPSFAAEGKRWIDVSILKQTLVAYEGTRPVYATLVSTGADGLGDPEKTHSTVRGVFLIHTKHITATMDSDEAEDRFDLRDVPYVQYFERGYALHAAYWHDDFGKPRSHGCINLHPTDAAWLFGWTTPDVPADWHGALTLRGGTVVYIHP